MIDVKLDRYHVIMKHKEDEPIKLRSISSQNEEDTLLCNRKRVRSIWDTFDNMLDGMNSDINLNKVVFVCMNKQNYF